MTSIKIILGSISLLFGIIDLNTRYPNLILSWIAIAFGVILVLSCLNISSNRQHKNSKSSGWLGGDSGSGSGSGWGDGGDCGGGD
ncbi:hypothetical protein SOPP22_09910 [Shewanella sp. OPT22]|nr:hypothetical protein SOPP22_09910 [Shewanella sp. OPT22]